MLKLSLLHNNIILSTPLEKKYFLRGFILTLVILLTVSTVLSAASLSERYGGQLVLTATSDPRSFNPILAKETSTTAVTGIIFEGLTETDGVTLEVKPALAKSWQVEKDGLVWRFNLRKDVFWSDGESFTADDIVFTFNRLIYNDNIPNSARDIFTIEGKEIKVEKIDDFKVKFTLPKRFAPFLRSMSQEILPEHILEEAVDRGRFNFTWGTDTDPDKIVATGPFLINKYRPGERITLKRNPKYYRKDVQGNKLPYLDRIVFLIVGNQDTALLRFLDNEVDYYSLRGTDYSLLKPKERSANFTIHNTGPAFGSNFLVFNQNRSIDSNTDMPYVEEAKFRWFSDLNFRKAIAHAIDKKMIIQIIMNGFGVRQDSAMSPSAGLFYNPDVEIYDYDLDKAKKILSMSGYKDRDSDGILEDKQGERLEFNLFTNSQGTERIQIAAIIKNDLARMGIKVNFLALEFNELVRRLTSTYSWDAVIIGLTGGIEPHFGKNVWNTEGSLHMWYPNQKEPATNWEKRINLIFDQAVQELDDKKRKVLYDEWQSIVSQNLPLIYTVLSDSMFAIRNKFGNLKPTSFGGAFHNLEEIYIKE